MFKLFRIKRGLILLVYSLIITILVILGTSKISTATQTHEVRGVWLTNVDSQVLFSSQNLKDALNRLNKLNFNTIYPTVWNGGYTLYPSSVAQKVLGQSIEPIPELKDRDILQEVIKEGHKKGLTVIPWFEYGFMTPIDSELAKRHPDWLTNRYDGTKVDSDNQAWLNPFHPEVQQFMIDLIMEAVAKYDLDGIQLDDHFSLPSEFGYDDYTVAMYTKELKGLIPSKDFYETFWVRWRADKINEFMKNLSAKIKAVKPDCLISLSPNPLHFSLPASLQDWFTWERREYISEIVLQVYRSDLPRFVTELERAEVDLAKTHLPVSVGILSGLKSSSLPINQIKLQVEEVRQHGLAGVSFFFYESLWNWSDEAPIVREKVIQRMFPNSVSRG
ncbi:family 10 glycosylhydrolase [Nostoc sp. KVJ3]|uniref:glycoside hydrolase family 10 protein n=1 Tax=Nostoc sp. KVJ3 TaxID=457945 RepID=UPI0022374AD9|nr:glycoside hydrolase family 10 protein [Nostoc sp. KVJ3]MCW5317894.1 family 10 glycosylhydrolase [Nostoc sp. KVJ3]